VSEIIKGDASGEAPSGHFSAAVALSGDGMILVIGEQNNDGNGIDSGRVDVYFWDEGSTNYEPLGEPIIGKAAGDMFGVSVALSEDGKTLAIGARGNDDNGSYSGHVKLFSLQDDRLSWKELSQVLNGEAGDGFGTVVSLSADSKTLAISAPYSDNFSGYVKVYMRGEGSSNYEQLGEPITGEVTGGGFGWSMSLSADGMTLVIGAPWNNEQSGMVRVYRIDEKGSSWEQLGQELISEDHGLFGW